ncbi:TonB-dependent siderophore receptor [Agrobacterium sp. Ap1]|uniref:TonB-dependent siderophore receptor n=1 Tax=Agrobacterium sp. Ap1 TaxID=2815337 RepID=UPI001A8F0E23|nr:TonB-dependent receptor [Agrobacterium sp. Ap1]MBO0144527.1 TonB-dependent siderophore receptor [Agrobacterium sp. Ap1]
MSDIRRVFATSRLTMVLLSSTMLSFGAADLISGAPAQAQQAEANVSFSIPSQALSSAVDAFSRATGWQIGYSSAVARAIVTRPVTGAMPPSQALQVMLSGTNVRVRITGPRSAALLATAELQGVNLPADDATVLEPIVVQAGATTEGSGSYTTSEATIGKGEQEIRRIPQAVSVVTRKQMDDRNVATIDDALEEAPGISLYDSPMGSRYVYSRGSAVDTMQYDGVARSTYYAQANSFSEDMAAFDRVEVLRGAAGLLQGAGNPGAAVNMVRKRPLETQQLSASQDIGSFQNYRTEVDATGPLNAAGSLRGRIVGSFNDREYFTDIAKSRNVFFYGILEADITDNTTVAFGGSYKHRTSTPCFTGLPHYSDGSDLRLPRDTCLGQSWNYWDTDQLSLFADVTHDINENWKWKTSADYWREQHDVKYEYSIGAINPTTLAGSSMLASLFDMETSNVAFDSYLDGNVDLFGRTHEVILGGSLSRLVSDNDFAVAPLGIAQNVFDPISIPEVDDNFIIANQINGGDTRNTIEQQALYGMTRLSLSDPLTVILGGRLSWYKHRSVSRDRSVQSSSYQENGVFTPYAGIVYDLDDDWSIYASYTDIFQPQTNVDASGETLEPILGNNYEIGIKGEVLDGRVNTSVSLFRGTTKNRAIFDDDNYPCASSPTGECYSAGGKVQSEGVELEVSGELFSGFQAAASYTYTHRTLLEGEEDYSFNRTFTPDHLIKIWGDYSFTEQFEGLTVGGGVRFQSETSRTVGITKVTQEPFAVVSARVGYKFNENVQAALSVDNLFDKRYYQTVGAPGWGSMYGDPRTFTFSLKTKF